MSYGRERSRVLLNGYADGTVLASKQMPQNGSEWNLNESAEIESLDIADLSALIINKYFPLFTMDMSEYVHNTGQLLKSVCFDSISAADHTSCTTSPCRVGAAQLISAWRAWSKIGISSKFDHCQRFYSGAFNGPLNNGPTWKDLQSKLLLAWPYLACRSAAAFLRVSVHTKKGPHFMNCAVCIMVYRTTRDVFIGIRRK